MKFNAEAALTRAQAVEALASRWEFEPRTEQVSVARACGRVLAQDCHARYDLPRHRVSSFDGIAVRSADFAAGLPDTSAWVRGVQFAQADTGDDFPDEFDTVIAAEDVTLRRRGPPDAFARPCVQEGQRRQARRGDHGGGRAVV